MRDEEERAEERPAEAEGEEAALEGDGLVLTIAHDSDELDLRGGV